jgi:flavin-dependent dehydrogenase
MAGTGRSGGRLDVVIVGAGPTGLTPAAQLQMTQAAGALARLGVGEVAHYLVRPDGHLGYRAAGTDLGGLERYLARWLPGPA